MFWCLIYRYLYAQGNTFHFNLKRKQKILSFNDQKCYLALTDWIYRIVKERMHAYHTFSALFIKVLVLIGLHRWTRRYFLSCIKTHYTRLVPKFVDLSITFKIFSVILLDFFTMSVTCISSGLRFWF